VNSAIWDFPLTAYVTGKTHVDLCWALQRGPFQGFSFFLFIFAVELSWLHTKQNISTSIHIMDVFLDVKYRFLLF
jgi:hypothetical protein